jgi:hypothetical protein
MTRTRAAAMRVARMLAATACLAFAFGPAHAFAQGAAQDAAPPDPSVAPQPDATVRDPDFGVAARHFGLQRHVEMFQWRLRPDGGYERAWSASALDASAFAPGHDNPPFPLRNRQWLAKEVRVDGVPLDPAVLSTLGRWVPFRPSFNALPGNLAATFQPQGDGLGTAENPVDPQVGDLRIHWRELRLPPLGDRIELRAARWVLRPGAAARTAKGADPASAAGQRVAADDDRHRWFAGLLLLAAAIAVGLLVRRKRAKRRRDRA